MDFSRSESSDFEDVIQVKELEDAPMVDERVENDALGEAEGEEKLIQKVEDASKTQKSHGELTLANVDAQWVNRLLASHLAGASAQEVLQHEKLIMAILGNESFSQRECEKKLFA